MNDAGEKFSCRLPVYHHRGRKIVFQKRIIRWTGKNGTHQQWFNPSIFLPEERLHYHYVGSLTTPPTKGPVKWFVFDTIQKWIKPF